MHKTTHSKLLTHIHNSVKQFKTFNANRDFPNILIWISHNFQLTFADLGDALYGYMSIENQVFYDFRSSEKFARLKNDIAMIDLHLWLQVNDNNESYDKVFIPTITKNHIEHFHTLDKIFNIKCKPERKI